MTTFTLRRTSLALAVCSVVLCAPAGAASLLDDAAPARDLYTAPEGYRITGFDVSALPDGRFAVVWLELDDSEDMDYVKLARFDAQGDPVGDTVTVQEQNLYMREPAVAAAADGDLVVAWNSSDKLVDRGCTSVRYKQVSHEDTVSEGRSLPHGSNSRQCYGRVAMNGEGVFVLGWYDEPSEGRDMYLAQAFNADGTATTTSPIQVGGAIPDVVLPPALTIKGDTFTMAWPGGEDGLSKVRARRYNVNGVSLDAEGFRLDNEEQSGDVVYQSQPALAVGEDGDFVGVWRQVGFDGDGNYESLQLGHHWAADGTAGAALAVGQDPMSGGEVGGSEMSVATNGEGLILVGWVAQYERSEGRVAAFQGQERLGDGPVTVFAAGPDTSFFSSTTRVAVSGRAATAVWYQQESGENAVIRARSFTVPAPAEAPAPAGDDNGGGGSSGGASGPLALLGLGLLALRRRLR
ncbi:hypothetical protein [Alloalcanivorax gelatiniphagus]|uniref:Uncharacterized protein n=2 Tax=Alloalcanivorax gelatiniphagus TaxID=1194167 RepID=A0ABY2XIM7_9GAMM|nr:hypothetical protein [Alloalcanivorax gelatiniphagus]TMW11682.1 hypothetical protein FGS76_13985 [Alloalcanivorax gelatiniphagus]